MRTVKDVPFDLVVTLCSDAEKKCPLFPAPAKSIHVPFDDPLTLAFGVQSDHEALAIYRRVRDQIRDFVEKLAV
jgi:arsenate reductase